MIAKLEKGRGFRGALNYALEKNGARLIGGNLASTKPRGMAREFRAFREMRPKLSKAVAHVALSVEHGANLSDEQWSEIGERYMQGMGYGEAAYTLVRHNDAEHDHVHIIASRIRPDGSVVSDSNDFRRQERIMRAIEQDFNLQAVPNSWESKGERALNKNEIEKADRTGEPPARAQLQALVSAAAKAADNYTDFALALERCGVRHEVQLQKEGQKWNGVKFSLDGEVWFKGSDLGKQFTANGLQKNGVVYGQGRDYETAGRFQINKKDGSQDARAGGRSRGPGGSVTGQPEIGRSVGAGGPEVSEINAEGARTGRSSGQGAEQQQGRNQVSDGHSAVHGRGYRGPDFNADITAAAVGASGEKFKSKALQVKENTWQRQHEALQADRYRITLLPRVEGRKPWNIGKREGQPEQFWTADQLTEKLGFLSKKNAEGYDVYLTPFKQGRFFLVVDDMTAENQKALLNNGFTPALIQESSEDNRQAVLIVEGGVDEQEAANRAVSGLNKHFGDPNFHGYEHAFRMAGFSNKKPGRKSAFTRILSAAHRLCGKAVELINRAKEMIQDERQQAEAERQRAIERTDKALRQGVRFTFDPAVAGDAEQAFLSAKEQILRLVEQKGWVYDESRADYMACQELFRQGFSQASVYMAVLFDPSVSRKTDPESYAALTAEKAWRAGIRKPEKEPETPETRTDQGLEQSDKQQSPVKQKRRKGLER